MVISTPRLKEKSGAIGNAPAVPKPTSLNAPAKPNPWISPKAKVSVQRPGGSPPRTRFSRPTKTIVAAINGSTMRLDNVTIFSPASARVIECATVKQVMITATDLKRRKTTSNPNRNVRIVAPR